MIGYNKGRLIMEERNYRIPVIKLSVVKESVLKYQTKKVSCSTDAYGIAKKMIGNNDREEMIAMMLDSKNNIMAVHPVSVGTLNLSLVHPRETFKAAIVHQASGIILAHNHPSGDCTPSKEDIELTDRLKKCGDLLGIRILDHIVVGDDRYYSFADEGKLQ